MPSKSPAPAFAKKAGIPPKVAKDFSAAKGKKPKSKKRPSPAESLFGKGK